MNYPKLTEELDKISNALLEIKDILPNDKDANVQILKITNHIAALVKYIVAKRGLQ